MEEIYKVLQHYDTISLEGMKSVKLMNRIDTKYVIAKKQLGEILRLSSERYYVQTDNQGNRIARYHTVYLDTDAKQMYIHHETCRKTRCKIRVRTYADSNESFLEVKKKNNHGRTAKKRIPVVSSLTDVLKRQDVNEFISSQTSYNTASLSPHVETHFQRITLVNKEKTERLTIDVNLSFRNVQNGRTEMLDNIAIIELKREGRSTSFMKQLLLELHVRECGFSKYCIGTAITDPTTRQNNFKERIKKIRKLNIV